MAFFRNVINTKIWRECSEDKKQAKNKQIADGTGTTEDDIKTIVGNIVQRLQNINALKPY